MKTCCAVFAIGCLAALTSCSNPVEEHHLTAEQLAWQGYRNGEVLRFAQRPAGPIRTYRITDISTQMERQQTGINFTLFPSRKIDCEHLVVAAQRTDTTAASTTVLDFALNYDPGQNYSPGQDIYLWATANWERFYASGLLPLNEINQGVPFDTLLYPGVKLLPAATFGGVAYAPVVRLVSAYTPPAGTTIGKAVRVLFYAKGKGVVAFEEAGALWYRLP